MTKHDQVWASNPSKGVPAEASPLGTDEALIIKDGIVKRSPIEDLPVPAGADVFSNSETLTDKTWLGKPVYRKVINMGTGPSFGTKNVAHGITGQTQFVGVKIFTWDGVSGFGYTLVDVGASVGQVELCFASPTNVNWYAGLNRTSFTGYAVVEYTKT
jgi:hypothetical protein